MRSLILGLLAVSCETFTTLTLPDTTTTQATSVPAATDLPAYCRVAASSGWRTVRHPSASPRHALPKGLGARDDAANFVRRFQ
jgi:hypothetical protein